MTNKSLIFTYLHLHNFKAGTDRLETSLRCLRDIFDIASQQGCKSILFAGDLFEQANTPAIVLTKTMEMFDYLFDAHPEIDFYAITGNHDHSRVNIKGKQIISNVRLFWKQFQRFHIIDDQQWGIAPSATTHGIPFYRYPEHFDLALDTALIHLNESDTNVLLIHQAPKIKENQFINWEVDPNDPRFDRFDLVVCGHIHYYVQCTENFYQLGSPMHRDASDAGQEKFVMIWDWEKKEVELISMAGRYPEFKIESEAEEGDFVIPAPKYKKELTHSISLDMQPEEMLKEFCEHIDKKDYLPSGLTFIK